MVKFLLELGIDPSKMNALEVEDKLLEVKQKLREGFEAAQKEMETKEREIAKKQYDAIESLGKLIAPQVEIQDDFNKRIDELTERIDELTKKLEPVKDLISDLQNDQWKLREEIGEIPEVVELRNNATRMRERFRDYMDILEKEAKSLTKFYVRKDLSDAVKSMKQLGVKKE